MGKRISIGHLGYTRVRAMLDECDERIREHAMTDCEACDRDYNNGPSCPAVSWTRYQRQELQHRLARLERRVPAVRAAEEARRLPPSDLDLLTLKQNWERVRSLGQAAHDWYHLYWYQHLIDDAARERIGPNLAPTPGGAAEVPARLEEVLDTDAWRAFSAPMAGLVQHTSLLDVIIAEPLRGIHTTVHILRMACADHPVLVARVDQQLVSRP